MDVELVSDCVVWNLADCQLGFELLANGFLEQCTLFFGVLVHATNTSRTCVQKSTPVATNGLAVP